MKVRARVVGAFFGVLLAAWLLTLLLNIYTFESDVKISQYSDLSVIPGSAFANLWWFVQISDIHISKYGNPGAINDFQIFCAKTVDVIKPELVLSTGDLTHGKHGGFSTQYKEEWEIYKTILKETGVLHKTRWIDMRGNHDAFDISSWSHQSNYYRDYSSDKKRIHQIVSRYIHQKSFEWNC
jgi:predicted MPP superfamily phosphohydrolase